MRVVETAEPCELVIHRDHDPESVKLFVRSQLHLQIVALKIVLWKGDGSVIIRLTNVPKNHAGSERVLSSNGHQIYLRVLTSLASSVSLVYLLARIYNRLMHAQ